MRNRVVLFASAILIAGCAVVQGAPQSDDPSAPLRDEVLAGVRGFSDEQIDALVRLSADSQLMSWLAENPARLAEPDRWPSPPQADVRLAAERLRELPELVEIAAAFPERLSELRRAWEADSRRVAARLAEMRHRFDQAESARRALWAEMLASDPLARGEYRDLLSRFCRAERASNPAFPCVQALDRDAYLHAPPDVLVLAFAERDSTGRALGGLLDRFISRSEAERFEERALRGELANAPVRTVAVGKLATQVRDTSEPTPDSIGLLPAFLLPPELQSEDVRVALALAEQDRLWGMTAPTPMAPAFAADADPDAMTAASPAIDPSMNGWADDDAAMDAPPVVAGLAPDPVVVFDDGPAFAPDVVVVERSAPTVFVDYGGIDTIFARPYGWPWSFSSTIVWGAPLYTAVCYPYIPVVATCRLAESRRWYSVHYGRSYRDWGGRCDSRRQLVFEARRSRGDCDRRGFSAVAAFGRVSDGGTRAGFFASRSSEQRRSNLSIGELSRRMLASPQQAGKRPAAVASAAPIQPRSSATRSGPRRFDLTGQYRQQRAAQTDPARRIGGNAARLAPQPRRIDSPAVTRDSNTPPAVRGRTAERSDDRRPLRDAVREHRERFGGNAPAVRPAPRADRQQPHSTPRIGQPAPGQPQADRSSRRADRATPGLGQTPIRGQLRETIRQGTPRQPHVTPRQSQATPRQPQAAPRQDGARRVADRPSGIRPDAIRPSGSKPTTVRPKAASPVARPAARPSARPSASPSPSRPISRPAQKPQRRP